MFWNYRVIKTGKVFHIHEVYYNNDGTICGISEDPMRPHGETLKDLKGDAEYFLLAFDNPVLIKEKIKFAEMDALKGGFKRVKKPLDLVTEKKKDTKRSGKQGK